MTLTQNKQLTLKLRDKSNNNQLIVMIQKIARIFLSTLFCILLVAKPSWAINVSPGDRIELQATSSLGVPLHDRPSPSLVGRTPDKTIAEVVAIANDQRWIEIKLPSGAQNWIVERYIGRIVSSSGETIDTREVTNLLSGEDKLTVAAMNVENLDPDDSDRLNPLGKLIVNNLKSPDIIVLIEIQDNDGPNNSDITDGTETYNALIDAITTATGPDYIAFDIPPGDDKDGGQPGGNIRVGYLYQPSRVALNPGTAGTATDTVTVLEGPTLSLNPGRIEPDNGAFQNSRKPIVAEFQFKQNPIFIIGNHFVSQRGGNDDKRRKQATVVGNFVKALLSEDSKANVIVAGDLNDVIDSEPITILERSGLTNLSKLLPPSDRYTYEFNNNLQQLDYILVSDNLFTTGKSQFDIVHVNVNQPSNLALSDHDVVLGQFPLPEMAEMLETPSSESIFPDLSGEALRSRLATEYRVKTSLGYDNARDFMYSELDNENGMVRGIYSDFTVEVNPNSSRPRSDAYQKGKGINAEHSWPQSKGATGVAKSDIHHLFPTQVRVNSLRGSFPFAEIEDSRTERWLIDNREENTIPSSNIDAYSEWINGGFEPKESVKGNIARALFYFYTIYRDQAEEGFFEGQQDTLCDWNVNDPVDAAELKRTHEIALKQGNDNPFVVDPTLAKRLYCNP
ncbi:unknown [Crocosphaera subtropica ATCC 51142]|uniref:Endonuclease/exonuclease/phosphatase domain-containing protein n=2 Tax=Crocosphaera TaxID=263510 RepID=B1WPW5_CROS5|nr:unknown [Crocosphaera subtropica ATCC 51142]